MCNFTSNYVGHHLPYLSSSERSLEHSTLIHSSSSLGTHVSLDDYKELATLIRNVLYRTIRLFPALVLLLHVRLIHLL